MFEHVLAILPNAKGSSDDHTMLKEEWNFHFFVFRAC